MRKESAGQAVARQVLGERSDSLKQMHIVLARRTPAPRARETPSDYLRRTQGY